MAEVSPLLIAALAVTATMLAILVWSIRRRGRGSAINVGSYARLELEVLGPPPQPNALVAEVPPLEPVPERLEVRDSVDASPNVGATRSVPLGGVLADGALPAALFAWKWAAVDTHLFRAVEQMTHQTVDSVADLSRAIDGWDSGPWTGPSAGLVTQVKGHLAEWIAADHLTQAGHDVVMPTASNQEAWDLNIDGHLVNVKSWNDAGGAMSAHFSEHPDVPILVPHDSAHLPVDAHHFDASHGLDPHVLGGGDHVVLVDDSLSHVGVHDATADGLDVASGHLDFHLPLITIALASIKEGLLVLDGQTDLLRAAKNVTVSAVSVGAGVAVGAKGGALVGMVAGPPGAFVGGLVGGMFGGIFGRGFAQGVNEAPLVEAREAFERAAAAFEKEREAVVARAEFDWQQDLRERQRKVKQEASAGAAVVVGAVRRAQQMMAPASSLPGDVARSLLDRTEKHIDDCLAAATRERDAIGWPQRLWRSSERFVKWAAFARAWRSARVELEKGTQGPFDTAAVFDLVISTPGGDSFARHFLTSLGRTRSSVVISLERAAFRARNRALRARSEAAEELRERRDVIRGWVDSSLRQPLESVRGARELFVSELRKAGHKVPG